MSVLWLHRSNFSSKQRALVDRTLQKAGSVNIAEIFYVTLHFRVKNLWVRRTKTIWEWNREKKKEFWSVLTEYVEKTKPNVIVINDEATLGFITERFTSLDQCRGSVFHIKINDKEYPCLVVNDILQMIKQKWLPWVFINDFKKLKRWHDGKPRNDPRFTYTVVRNMDNFHAFSSFYRNGIICSCDIETISNIITCIGFTILHVDGSIHSYVIPFYNSLKPNNCHWQNEEDEIYIWEQLRILFKHPIVKTFQNGSYDCAWLLRYHITPVNYLLDSQHLYHCIWTEAKKKLNIIASIFMDHMRYWKDELKGDKDERFPTTEEGVERYWRYNGYDCYTTLICSMRLLALITHPNMSWALYNYCGQIGEFTGQIGPALLMTMTGMKVDQNRQYHKTEKWRDAYEKSLKELRIMVDDEDYNPNSPDQTASLIYDVLGAQPIKKRGKKDLSRSTDEKILRLIKTQHVIYDIFIEKIWDTKKPRAKVSKYGSGNLQLVNNRFLYSLSAGGTETGRYNGKEHMFRAGTNPQNLEKKEVRDMMVADKGYLMFEMDYSQSDNWFVAFESEDPDMMRNIADDRDTHSVHAAYFFQKKYEAIYEGHKNGEEWVEHPTKGVRQLTKKIVHGSNYRMRGMTMYIEMQHEAVVNTAKVMGHKDAHLWSRKALIGFCDWLIESYYKMYGHLPVWFNEIVEEAVKNGNRATCAFGRTRLFFGNIADDESIQRELSAYYGQGGTSGNINRTLNNVYYESTGLLQRGLMLLTQTHDSITGQVPIPKRDELLPEFKSIMEQPCTIKGRTFTVPVECQVGFSWGKGLIDWEPGMDLKKVEDHERKIQESYR